MRFESRLVGEGGVKSKRIPYEVLGSLLLLHVIYLGPLAPRFVDVVISWDDLWNASHSRSDIFVIEHISVFFVFVVALH